MLVPLARAQPRAAVVFPAAGQGDVAVDASIVIGATHTIIPPSITYAWPDGEASGWRADEPTVLIVDDAWASTQPRDRWSRRAIAGSYTLADPRTLRFKPRQPLRRGAMYRCVVNGLQLSVPSNIYRVPPQSFSFTTAKGIPVVAASTLDSTSVVRCAQSLFITFSDIAGNTLADASARVRITAEAGPGEVAMSVPFQVVKHEKLKALELRPIGAWPLQRSLSVALPWGTVTGDPHNSKAWCVVARGASQLEIDVVTTDGRPIPADIIEYFKHQECVITPGSTVPVVTSTWFDNRWRFVRWESRDFQSINHQSELSLNLTAQCQDLKPKMQLYAILERVDTMRLVVQVSSGGSVMVRDEADNMLRVLTKTDTIILSDKAPSLTLTATALPGYSFAGWQTPVVSSGNNPSVNTNALAASSLNGSAGASVVIKSQAFGGNTQAGLNQGYIQPNFPVGKVSQPAEMYSLRAAIVDESPEPSYSAQESVVFTTPSQFAYGQEVERTPCVKAGPCWEIVSVNDVAEGGGNRALPAGTEQVCETALLTDPENEVTFTVRRRRIQLRVEKVLISSDNANEVIAGRHLHPESYVIVERQTGIEGAYAWRPLIAADCNASDDIEYNTYEVRCGDVVRFRIRGSSLRGEAWKFWANKPGYVLPGSKQVVGEETRYTLIVDRDLAQFDGTDCSGTNNDKPEIRFRACFRQQFGIDAIGLRVRTMLPGGSKASSTFREVWVDPLLYYDAQEDEPADGRQLEYVPYYGTIVRFKFTTPIDIQTVFDGGMKAKTYGNVNVNNTLADNLDFSVNSFDDEHIGFAPLDGSPVDIVEFRVCDPTTSPRKQALHFGNISMFCSTSLKSTSGEALPTRFSFLLHSMERAGYGLFLERAKWNHDGDDDFWPFTNDAELYNVLYGAVLTPTAAEYSDIAFQRLPDCREQQGTPPSECVFEYNEDDGYFGFAGKTLLFEPSWLGDRDYVFSHIVSYDEDCKDEDDCLVNKVYDLLDAVRGKTAGYQPSDAEKSAGISWETVVPDLIDLGAQFIQALLPIDDQDEYIGQATLLNSASELWGAAEPTAPYIIRFHDNGEYVYRTRLFPRRAVKF